MNELVMNPLGVVSEPGIGTRCDGITGLVAAGKLAVARNPISTAMIFAVVGSVEVPCLGRGGAAHRDHPNRIGCFTGAVGRPREPVRP